MNCHNIIAEGGIVVPLFVAEAKGLPIAACLLVPALGVPAGFYMKLAEGLACGGVTTVVIEQRGNGESPYRANDGSAFALTNYLSADVEAAYQWLIKYTPNAPLYIGGHSLGGHIASLFVAHYPERFAGIIHFACGIPYPAYFSFPSNVMIKTYASLVPIMRWLFGYFPGKKTGFCWK